MLKAADAKREAILRRLAILDNDLKPLLDALLKSVKASFRVSSILIYLIDDDRQWFKAGIGFDPSATAEGLALCNYAFASPDDILVVPDASADGRFCYNPAVTGDPFIRFYAAAPIIIDDVAVGVVCLFDTVPNYQFCEVQRRTLATSVALIEEFLRLQLETNERRSKERALKVATRKMVLAEELSGVGHWTLEPASGKVSWSPQVYAIHGLSPTAFDPQLGDALAFYEPDSRTLVAAHVEHALTTSEGFSFRAQLVRASDSALRTVLCKAEMSCAGGKQLLIGVFQDVTDQDALLQKVSDDREHYKLLTQNATDVIAAYKPDGTFTYLSPAIASLIGHQSSELIGRKTYEVIHPDDQKRVNYEFRALLESRASSARIEYRALHADGCSIWVEAHPTPIYDDVGQLSGFQDVVRNVSARKAAEMAAAEAARRAEQALAVAAQSESRYRLLAENANDMIALTSPLDSGIHFVSPGCRRVLGYEPEELLGRTTISLTHPDDARSVVRFFRDLIAAGPADKVTPYQFRGLHKDGRWLWLEGQPRVVFDDAGRPIQFQDVVRDITARKAAETKAYLAVQRAEDARVAAYESERRYRLLAENATDMIARFSMSGRIKFISPSCERLLGFTPDELIGRRTLDLTHPEDIERIKREYEIYIAAGPGTPTIETQFRAICKDGRVVWLEGRPTIVFSATDAPLEMYDVVRDITHRKQLERDLENARIKAEAAAQAKSDFLANMSHELRTPLTGILGYADVLNDAAQLAPVAQQYLDLIRQSGRTLLTLVNDVLDLSKIEAGGIDLDPKPVNLNKMLLTSVELLRPQAYAKGLKLRHDIPADASVVSVDEDRLRQVVLNLLGNAIKFTDAGEISLSLSCRKVTAAQLSITIAVRDNGIGIAPDRIAQVFDRFEQADSSITRRFGGTGLGLAISRALVERMGGEISVESVIGRGSTFTVSLDLDSAELRSAPSAKTSNISASQLSGIKVLLAEDVEINRDLISIFLSKHGVLLTSVENGAQAVEIAGRESFDLILMDMQMPVLDGVEAARIVRASTGPCAKTPILALTANVLPIEIAKCSAAGMNGHVSKPFTMESLTTAIKLAL